MQELSRRQRWEVLLIACILAILFTWPLAHNPQHIVPGYTNGYCDSPISVWNFWITDHQLQSFASHGDFFHTNWIYPPFGIPLTGHTLCLAKTILLQPINQIAGPEAALNAAFILTLIVIFVFMFFSAHRMGTSFEGSIFAGFVLTYSSYIQSHLAAGHLNLISIEFLAPGFVLLIILERNARMSTGILLGICLGITAWMSWINLLFFIVGLIVVSGCMIVHKWRNIFRKHFLAASAIALVTSACISLPVLYPLIRDRKMLQKPAGEAVKHGADILAYLLPTPINSVFGHFTSGLYSTMPGGWMEQSVFPGWTVVFLAGIGIFTRRMKAVPFVVLGIISWILSLGPALNIGSKTISIPLPFSLLQHVPLFTAFRVPARFVVLLLISLAFLSGWGFDQLRRTKMKRSILGLLIGLSVLERFSVPFPMLTLPESIPETQLQSARNTVVFLPVDPSSRINQYLQINENKPALTGFLARIPRGVLEPLSMLCNGLGISSVTYSRPPPADPVVGRDFIAIFKVGAFICNSPVSERFKTHIEATFPVSPARKYHQGLRWDVQPGSTANFAAGARLYPVRGWSGPQTANQGVVINSTNSDSHIAFFPGNLLKKPNINLIHLDILLKGLNPHQSVLSFNVSFNGTPLTEWKVRSSQFASYRLNLDPSTVLPGLNWLTLTASKFSMFLPVHITTEVTVPHTEPSETSDN